MLCSALQPGVNQLKEVDEQMQANVERAEQELQLLVEPVVPFLLTIYNLLAPQVIISSVAPITEMVEY